MKATVASPIGVRIARVWSRAGASVRVSVRVAAKTLEHEVWEHATPRSGLLGVGRIGFIFPHRTPTRVLSLAILLCVRVGLGTRVSVIIGVGLGKRVHGMSRRKEARRGHRHHLDLDFHFT